MSKNAADLVVAELRVLMDARRTKHDGKINKIRLSTFWQVGREHNGEFKAQYGAKILTELSKRLSSDMRPGFSRANLYNMREFY
ncbi:MAG: DUF1016 N-terminal domain-containing protein [Deltaproteobacteria bacterium]|jgi:hypothetical protein|nr:DUF1016 N-terminal domain-containing protein [Deltaproteobacteria bacterium]